MDGDEAIGGFVCLVGQIASRVVQFGFVGACPVSVVGPVTVSGSSCPDEVGGHDFEVRHQGSFAGFDGIVRFCSREFLFKVQLDGIGVALFRLEFLEEVELHGRIGVTGSCGEVGDASHAFHFEVVGSGACGDEDLHVRVVGCSEIDGSVGVSSSVVEEQFLHAHSRARVDESDVSERHLHLCGRHVVEVVCCFSHSDLREFRQ